MDEATALHSQLFQEEEAVPIEHKPSCFVLTLISCQRTTIRYWGFKKLFTRPTLRHHEEHKDHRGVRAAQARPQAKYSKSAQKRSRKPTGYSKRTTYLFLSVTVTTLTCTRLRVTNRQYRRDVNCAYG